MAMMEHCGQTKNVMLIYMWASSVVSLWEIYTVKRERIFDRLVHVAS